MDSIILEGIEVYAWGGVSAEERAVGQRYRLRIVLAVDLRAAGESDRVENTIHYGLAHDVAVAALRGEPFNLIEAGAARVAGALLTQFPVQEVTVRLEKLLPPIDGVVAAAGVEITRRR